MQRSPEGLIYSPQDLIQFINSQFAVWMDRYALEYPEEAPQPDEADEMLETLYQLGQEHEQHFLSKLQAAAVDVYIVSQSGGVEETLAAMKAGHDYIYQAELRYDNLRGYADFLVKTDRSASVLGNWSYFPLECKLALNPKPHFVVQATCYCYLLQQLQGRLPDHFALLMGDGSLEYFPSEQYIYYYHQIRNAFREFMGRFKPQIFPVPAVGDHGRWRKQAEKRLSEIDHLSQVANITRNQIRSLEAAGIKTTQQLAEIESFVKGYNLNPQILRRLVQQARLQKASDPPQSIEYEVVRPEPEAPRQGLALLPPASAMDIFFDLEGYPLANSGGLEYLFGASYLEGETLHFKDWWAHNEQQEKVIFQHFIDWIYERWQADPLMHIYHYAPYETIALKRLMGKYGTREEQVDDLLRAEIFIDLYQIVRQGLRVGTNNYSIKDLEPLYDCQRQGAVKTAQASVVQYFQWQQSSQADSPDQSPLLKAIRDYNQLDCDSTKLLADWLRQLQITHVIPYLPPQSKEEKKTSERKEVQQTTAHLAEKLLAEIPLAHLNESQKIQQLFAHLLEFHHREDKPIWWQRFAMLKMNEDELFQQLDALAGLTRIDTDPYQASPRSRSLIFEYQFDPKQETKLKVGSQCWFVPTEMLQGASIRELSLKTGEVKLAISKKSLERFPDWQPPYRTSLIDAEYISTANLAQSIFETVNTWQQTGQIQPALEDFLRRRNPRIDAHPGGAIAPKGTNLLEGTITAVSHLTQSTLCIQGPPGSGKTYTASHVILALLRQGKTIAVTANSHKVINNLLVRVAKLASEKNYYFQAAKIDKDKSSPLFNRTNILYQSKIQNALPPKYQLVGATPFQLCKPDAKNQWDYLFIDEAGQLSLANLVAIARCAQNLVLMGDQMQLEQPIQGTHPGESGQSALGYLLDGKATVPPELGIFLDTSYRMHPAICRFISQSVYEGRLHHASGTEQHRIIVQNQRLIQQEYGLFYLPVIHEGNSQSSPEEIEAIAQLVKQLLGSQFINERGAHQAKITSQDILIVAPYNYQVMQLQNRLGKHMRIGTVDKFQGQEAPVVIISMCASSGETAPRGLDFLLNCNRLNVAVSRAQCLTIVVGSPALAKTNCTSIKEIEQVNLFCKLLQQ